MSVLPKESVKILAETVGIGNLNDEIAAALAADVEYRLREIAQEAMKFMRHSKREKLTPEDINNALRLRNVETLYGFSSSDEAVQFVKASGTTDLFFIDDKELDFNEVMNAPLPPCPLDTTITTHWLAVEGVQPAIRQNPSPEEVERALGIATKKRKTSSIIEKPIEVKPIVKHVISKELQLYYKKITDAILNQDGEKTDVAVETALKSISHDAGLHQLLPYFSQFISDEVTHNLRKLKLLRTLMRMVKSLLDSPFLKIEPYLHQLMPAILTCLVGKRLCEKPTENHWELRDYSASLVAYICRRFGASYKTLQGRITKTLVHAFLDPTKPLTTHYGAISGLSALGVHVIQLLLLPNLAAYYRLLEPELNPDNPNQMKLFEARKVHSALLRAAGKFLFESTRVGKVNKEEEEEEEEDEHEDKATATMMDVEQQDGTNGGHSKESETAKKPVEIDSKEIFGDASKYYKELYNIFGESLDPYLAPSTATQKVLPSFSNSFL
eukprot:TRINITY_DN652_c0_g1_i2.p1 TRINITY_DN652_c0_g1~~TRINITY_DN652_c0_g1_i2.p1  ORF type:complete len:498 (-),score=138.83 TRINITY_DN652_c0_g1_i2:28-1521(-)